MEKNNDSKLKVAWKSYIGDFSFRSVISLLFTFFAVGVSPFLAPDTDWKTLTIGWALFTIVKVAFNLFTKYTLANETIEKLLKTDEELLETHDSIKSSRIEIESKKYSRYLSIATNEENTRNKLDKLYDKVNVQLTKAKTDEEIFNLTDKLEQIQLYRESLDGNKDCAELRKALAKDLANVKVETLTPSSLFSKNDTVARSKMVGMDINKALKLLMRNSLGISVAIIVLLNFIVLVGRGFSTDLLWQTILNLVVLFWNAALGIDGAKKIISQYKDVALYKDTFLKMFIVKAEHYAKPSDEELEELENKRKQEEEKQRLNKKEEEKQKRLDEIETRKQERLDKIEDMKLEQEFKIKQLEIEAEIKKAEAEITAKTQEINRKVQEEQTLNIKVVTDDKK